MGNIKNIVIDNGNRDCIFSFYGLNRLRCSRRGNEGNYCKYWKCEHFVKGG